MTEENRNEQEESQATEDSVNAEKPESSESKVESTDSAVFAFGEEATTAFPTHVEAALKYSASNKYEYGPRLRNSELKWSVLSAERMANDIVRVNVQYTPTSGFRGNPGTEYMDIDAGGAVLARRQLTTPKENNPVVLMGITAFSVVLAVVLISLMTVFKGEAGDPLYVAGRTLWIRAEFPKQQQFITYSGADTSGNIYNWAMKPDDEANNELVYVEVTLINQTSGTVNLVVDESAATLLDGNKTVYSPINTITRAYSAESAPRFNVAGFVPMWGSVKLNEGQQVTGMLVFELPAGSSFNELRWRASDSATIRYQ